MEISYATRPESRSGAGLRASLLNTMFIQSVSFRRLDLVKGAKGAIILIGAGGSFTAVYCFIFSSLHIQTGRPTGRHHAQFNITRNGPVP